MSEIIGSNPFATRYIKPGALSFLFPPGQSAAALVEKLAQQRWWGAIVGPHGAGKSTLLHALEGELMRAGRQCVRFRLKQNERSLPLSEAGVGSWNSTTQVVVDGYEQVGWWVRWRLKSLCRRRGAGLLVTAHTPVAIAELCRIAPTAEVAQQVVTRLLADAHERQSVASPSASTAEEPTNAHTGPLITGGEVAAAFARNQGNLRETLFELHDVYRNRMARS
jgi:energy-coupling factor transporter ATP-binding protein EcfA2